MKKTIIFLNAPPDAGKDTIAAYLECKYGFKTQSFKEYLIDLTCRLFCFNKDEFKRHYDTIVNGLRWKDTYHPKFNRTPREALIFVSEVVIKPNFGKEYFGVVAADNVASIPCSKFVFSDCGFEEEILPFRDTDWDIHIVRFHSPWAPTFAGTGDSRNYLYTDKLPPNFVTIHDRINSGSIDEFGDKLVKDLELC